MTDLVVFVGLVGLVAVVGILAGIIIAGRLDRILEPRPGPGSEDQAQHQEDQP